VLEKEALSLRHWKEEIDSGWGNVMFFAVPRNILPAFFPTRDTSPAQNFRLV
jgi:hypothetical protein